MMRAPYHWATSSGHILDERTRNFGIRVVIEERGWQVREVEIVVKALYSFGVVPIPGILNIKIPYMILRR